MWHIPRNINAPKQSVYVEPPVPWTPSQISTVAWYDASDLLTITESGGNVSQWDDKSGNGNNLNQSNSVNQPLSGGVVNGLNALSFDGQDDFFNSTLQQLTTLTMFYVVSPIGKGSNNNNEVIGANSSFSDGANCQVQQYSTGNPKNVVNYNSKLPDSNISYNGVVGGGPTTHTLGLFAHWGSGLYSEGRNYIVGSKYSGYPSDAFSGLMAELIIIPQVLDEATRQKMEGYLAWKWGLEGNLPVTHPYKNARPTI